MPQTFEELFGTDQGATRMIGKEQVFRAHGGQGKCANCLTPTVWAAHSQSKYMCSEKCLVDFIQGPEGLRNPVDLSQPPALQFAGLAKKSPPETGPAALTGDAEVVIFEPDAYNPPEHMLNTIFDSDEDEEEEDEEYLEPEDDDWY